MTYTTAPMPRAWLTSLAIKATEGIPEAREDALCLSLRSILQVRMHDAISERLDQDQPSQVRRKTLKEGTIARCRARVVCWWEDLELVRTLRRQGRERWNNALDIAVLIIATSDTHVILQ